MKRLFLYFLLVIINLSFINRVNSQTAFTLIDTINISYSELEWIDYDNDNDLDLFLFSAQDINIYENFGNDSFAININIPLPNLNTNNVLNIQDFGDYDSDGDIDLFAWFSSGGINYIVSCKNLLPDSLGFDTIKISLNNNTGHQHLVSGWDNIYNTFGFDIITNIDYQTPYLSFIYQLDSLQYSKKDSLFIVNNFYFLNNSHNNTNNYDINKDGYFDFITFRSININNGLDSSNRFRFIARPSYTAYYDGSYYFDIDCDGYIDEIANVFFNNNSPLSLNRFHKNNQNDSLIYQSGGILDTLSGCKKCIFDYNNDGYQDILLTKANGNNVIYINAGNFFFFENTNITNLSSNFINAAAADYDGDGDQDLAMLFRDTIDYHYYLSLYRNDSTTPNTPPTPPNGLYAEMDSTKLILRWQRATDIETPQVTLSYNLMVGTSLKGIDITSPMADTVTGFRRVVELGNAQLNDFYILDKSIFNIGDTVYWSVQTIDNGFGYSPFSQQCTTIICNSLKPQFDTICNNDSLLWQGNYYNTTGNYYQSYGSGVSCDSSFNLFLKADSAYLNLQQADICNGGGGYQWQGNTYYTSGTYNIYNTTTQGCDSIDRLILGVHHNFTNLQNEHICMGDSLAFGNNYLKSPGVYKDSLQSTFGCDSLVQLNLDISPEDTLVVQHGDSLIAQSTTASFRWWDCNAQNYIYAANNAVFVPYQNGSYAVEITENGCSYLTECVDVSGLNIFSQSSTQALESIKLQPNPATDWLSIVSSKNISITEINLFSIQGNLLISKSNISGIKPIKLNISTLPQGVYLLQFTTEYGMEYRRLIKE